MKSFREYLSEAEKKEKTGTYASLKLKESSKKRLMKWLNDHKVKNIVDEEDFHCTVVYSRKAIPELADKKVKLPVSATIAGWKILGKDCLVLLINSAKIEKLHEDAMEMGATHDYDEYIPHVTVATEYDKDLPEEIPPFKLFFDDCVVEELDLDFSYMSTK